MTIEIHIDKGMDNLVNKFVSPIKLGFGKYMAPVMMVSNYKDGKWSNLHVTKYGPLQIDPAAKVLHYAQEIFEGMKAYKNDDDEVFLFRPELNAIRFNRSASRMAMPEFPAEDFVNATRVMTDICRTLIPKEIGASLYLRPFMIATEPTLGIKPSKEYQFIIIASPAGNYFSKPKVSVLIERETSRASKGGTGYAKAGGNYAASLKSFEKLKEVNCDQTLWLDASEHRYIEELSGMNFFAIIDNEFHTPMITDSILEGITRKSIIELATEKGLKVVERKMDIDELILDIKSGKCSEAFACGTASVLTPIAQLVDENGAYELQNPEGKISTEIKLDLLLVQCGRSVLKPEWKVKV
jgi:branched-chain amino acid aminotransferase